MIRKQKLFVTLLFVGILIQTGTAQSAFEKGNVSLFTGFGAGGYGWGSFIAGCNVGVHEFVSVGGFGAIGWDNDYDYWPYNNFRTHISLGARGSFHPFNLPALKSKIPVRDKIDVYAGAYGGFHLLIADYRRDYVPLFFSPFIGGRYYLNDSFGFFVEHYPWALSWVYGGVVFTF